MVTLENPTKKDLLDAVSTLGREIEMAGDEEALMLWEWVEKIIINLIKQNYVRRKEKSKL